MTRVELKNKAKKDIEGKLGAFLIILLIILGVSLLTSSLASLAGGAGSLITILIAGPLALAEAKIVVDLVRKGKSPKPADLLYGFKEDTIIPALLAYVRQFVFTFLWSLLFWIPGIIKGISYSQMFYLMADDPKLSAKDAQTKSMAMMEGHKWDYFVLTLSFIPWALLVGITFGIASVYVYPYMEATFANFYKDLAAKNK